MWFSWLAERAHKNNRMMRLRAVLAQCAQWERPHALALGCGKEEKPTVLAQCARKKTTQRSRSKVFGATDASFCPHGQLMTDSIRRATLDDLDQLVPLFDAYRQFYGQQSDIIVAKQFLSDRLVCNESVVLIAEDDTGSAIGFVQLYPTFSSILAAPMYVLSDLFVRPDVRRRGVGTLLIKSAAETARAAGAVRVELATAIANVSAQRLYESLGWRRDDFYLYGVSL
ncbi:MAG: Acetyltransferase, GNAT family [Nitrospira sp.]|nr:MAG: Acetyltransferase, GNAT family [Nitrospira sp.]